VCGDGERCRRYGPWFRSRGRSAAASRQPRPRDLDRPRRAAPHRAEPLRGRLRLANTAVLLPDPAPTRGTAAAAGRDRVVTPGAAPRGLRPHRRSRVPDASWRPRERIRRALRDRARGDAGRNHRARRRAGAHQARGGRLGGAAGVVAGSRPWQRLHARGCRLRPLGGTAPAVSSHRPAPRYRGAPRAFGARRFPPTRGDPRPRRAAF